MRTMTGMLLIVLGGLLVAASSAAAQPPPGPPPGGGRGEGPPLPAATADGFVARMMRFDDNQDGKLARDEVKDPRLQALFDRADADKSGEVTKEELTALFAREGANLGPGGRGGPGGGPGGPFGPGPGGRGMGGPPQPGQVLSMGLQDRLGLTDDQKARVAELQKEVDARLDKILTVEQKEQLKEMRSRGPGGFGPPPGGPGGGGFDGGPGRPGRGPGPGPGAPEAR
jgi:hypothetical protein